MRRWRRRRNRRRGIATGMGVEGATGDEDTAAANSCWSSRHSSRRVGGSGVEDTALRGVSNLPAWLQFSANGARYLDVGICVPRSKKTPSERHCYSNHATSNYWGCQKRCLYHPPYEVSTICCRLRECISTLTFCQRR